jgi:hypothetical protein
VVSDDSDRNFDGNGPRTGVVVTFQVGVRRRGSESKSMADCVEGFPGVLGGESGPVSGSMVGT